ncbi:aldehyde dehydrogenase family protein [Pseudonocardia sp. KRD-184]|uniref:aldehyde dehydrogenase (NAD(+)) n=1 Tax=Pseudonocardia oceani TaxID=2792013 RepID=A0ABS6U442_9PSEU|nr:aldehyde dehydrogenase family protein [Pseudonocardia oceani]MBW0091385.1 aldehyde dehydrogenase family protein [Pseudonocardia oceani]MBW0096072.1 aldehyde dehydrogenase family protein [Pseudonocardia oceani]MBW0121046.1 aldehyde dehydrogenase family protein [Pseudonocardia oceani]MBW0126983.1 aldehyde dehydrogenase family protein [Pseudonocardia oceani]
MTAGVGTRRPGADLVRDRTDHLIGGRWVRSTGEPVAVVDPATERVVAHVPAGTAAEATAAVDAAHAAWPAWAATGVAERVGHVRALADALDAAAEEIGGVVATEVGMPWHLAVPAQVRMPAQVLRTTADLAEGYPWREPTSAGEVLRAPAGVVVAITPWNMPLHQIAAKIGPALVAGCTVVLKPSEVAPLCAYALAELVVAAGLPPGVVDVVSGTGPVVGEALVRDPRTAVVSFTGSVGAGARVAELAAPGIKRVCLELGGKSANVLLDDAPLDVAVPSAVQQAFFNSGQACNALTRLLVPAALHDEVCERLVAAVGEIRTGDPFDATSDLGPLVSAAQRDRVRGHVRRACTDGARLLTGGPDAPDGLDVGYYHRPTVFTDVPPDLALAHEEVFGPVLAVQVYDSGDAGAVELANSTDYGLAAGVWSADRDRARAVGARIRAGQVKVNGVRTRDSLDAPFGGYGRSGLGRELGRYGIDEFVEITSLLG